MEAKQLPRRPTDAHHSFVLGQNGSGKTAGAMYQFAWRSWHRMPWLVFNYKEDDYLDSIPGARELGMHAPIPKEPGIYILRPPPVAGSIDEVLVRANERRNVGMFIDEGINVGEHSKALRLVLTQGRSRRTPVIFLTQRPVFIGKFPLTEAKFLQTYFLQAKVDRATISEYMPVSVNDLESLTDHHSFYYDVEKRRLAKLGPVPFGDEVLDIFDARRARRFNKV